MPTRQLIAVINEGFKGSGLTARFVIQGKDLGRDKVISGLSLLAPANGVRVLFSQTWTELGVKSGDSVPTILWGRGG